MEPTANTVPMSATNAKVHALAICIRPRPSRRPDHQLACYPLSSNHGYEGVQGGLETVKAAASIFADEEASPAPLEGFQYALSHMGLDAGTIRVVERSWPLARHRFGRARYGGDRSYPQFVAVGILAGCNVFPVSYSAVKDGTVFGLARRVVSTPWCCTLTCWVRDGIIR